MKKTLIIHAGMHKTGTTTIQRWLSESGNLSGLYAFVMQEIIATRVYL
mgnify:CR=1 FL=1|jgi:hypothetical protein